MADYVHIVCPHCSAVNRVPEIRLAEGPRCGGCHQSLFDGHPIALTATTFQTHITANDIPVLVDFWAPWCAPCKMMAPAYEQAARQLEPRIRLAKLDTEQEPELGGRFAIRSIPTLVLFHRGREVVRQAGAIGAADIVRWVGANL